jgi:L-asparaginase / beta-aspartyl-peptidase
MQTSKELVFLIHGGAGTISKDVDPTPYWNSLRRIMTSLDRFTSSHEHIRAVDVAEYGVKLLEDDELFNAGRGSVYTADETHEMDAAIMDGETLRCGSVTLLRTVKNPIKAARLVMNHPDHNFIAGSSVESLCALTGLEMAPKSYFSTNKRYEQLLDTKRRLQVALDHDVHVDDGQSKGTVGCVCSLNGHVAAATSTGGMTNKLSGRIGDSPVIGAGTYANDRTCAVSATGRGEDFIRHVVAYDVSARMEYGGLSLLDAANGIVSDRLPKASGGLICVDSSGNYAMPFNSAGMFRGVRSRSGEMSVGIWEDLMPVGE